MERIGQIGPILKGQDRTSVESPKLGRIYSVSIPLLKQGAFTLHFGLTLPKY